LKAITGIDEPSRERLAQNFGEILGGSSSMWEGALELYLEDAWGATMIRVGKGFRKEPARIEQKKNGGAAGVLKGPD